MIKPDNYGKVWQSQSLQTYQNWYDIRESVHKLFAGWLRDKEIKTVLEVGCGFGVYPIEHKELLAGMSYTGVDMSAPGIDHCKAFATSGAFICGDFMEMSWPRPFDLTFAHAVIDHVYDPDQFILTMVKATKTHSFISIHHGYHPNLEAHDLKFVEHQGHYDNRLSVKEITKTLLQVLEPKEFIVTQFKDLPREHDGPFGPPAGIIVHKGGRATI